MKNPNLDVVPMCRNMEIKWLPSMATQCVTSRLDITNLNNKNKEIINKLHLLKHQFPKTREK